MNSKTEQYIAARRRIKRFKRQIHAQKETCLKYVEGCVSQEWFSQYESIVNQFKRGTLNHLQFDEEMTNLERLLTEEEVECFENAVSEEFFWPLFSCTRHFLVRLLMRFPNSFMPFLISRIQRLAKRCRRKKTEQGAGDGLKVVVDIKSGVLLTIYSSDA